MCGDNTQYLCENKIITSSWYSFQKNKSAEIFAADFNNFRNQYNQLAVIFVYFIQAFDTFNQMSGALRQIGVTNGCLVCFMDYLN